MEQLGAQNVTKLSAKCATFKQCVTVSATCILALLFWDHSFTTDCSWVACVYLCVYNKQGPCYWEC